MYELILVVLTFGMIAGWCNAGIFYIITGLYDLFSELKILLECKEE